MSDHYYTKDGTPTHWVPKKDGKGTRPTTVADCIKLQLLPSPSTILKLLAKPALEDWKARQQILAVMTAPDLLIPETIDQKITRVLDVERQHEQESSIARDMGTAIHEAIQNALSGKPWSQSLIAYVCPVLIEIGRLGRVAFTEKVLLAKDHAGLCDCGTENDEVLTLLDFKSCKLPPKSPYPEHRMQLASYAASLGNTGDKRIECVNIYISKTEPGLIAAINLGDWQRDYKLFRLLLEFWYLNNNIEMPK